MVSQKVNLKKFEKQLEGLDIAEKIFIDILTDGIGSLTADNERDFKNYAQIMSNHYLNKFKMLFERMSSDLHFMVSNQIQSEEIFHGILDDIVFMQSSVHKIRMKLKEKVESCDGTIDAELRGLIEYNVNVLRSKTDFKNNVCIFPLSFHCVYDSNIRCWYQRYFWIDMEDGSIYHTLDRLKNRPVNVIPKEHLFKKHHVTELYYASDDYNGLINWNNKEAVALDSDDYLKLISFAETDIPTAVNKMKGYIKNTLNEKCYPVILPVLSVGMVGNSLVMEDDKHFRIVLRQQDNIDSTNRSICHLMDLPYEYKERQSVFGILFYNEADFTIYFHPHTLFTQNKIYRLID